MHVCVFGCSNTSMQSIMQSSWTLLWNYYQSSLNPREVLVVLSMQDIYHDPDEIWHQISATSSTSRLSQTHKTWFKRMSTMSKENPMCNLPSDMEKRSHVWPPLVLQFWVVAVSWHWTGRTHCVPEQRKLNLAAAIWTVPACHTTINTHTHTREICVKIQA